MPYFLSNPFNAAIANGAQSVSGMNPTRTVANSGLSEPAAHAACITPGSSIAPLSAAPACKKRRREMKTLSPIAAPERAKKSARQCFRTAGRLYPETFRPPLVRCLKLLIHSSSVMQSGCQFVLLPARRCFTALRADYCTIVRQCLPADCAFSLMASPPGGFSPSAARGRFRPSAGSYPSPFYATPARPVLPAFPDGSSAAISLYL